MKSVLITGGNEGIGFHMVSQLLKDGKRVAVLDLHINNLEELKEKYKDDLLYFICDVSDESTVKSCTEKVIAEFGSLEYAIHNACKCLFTSLEHTSDRDYKAVFDVNYFGAVHLARAVLPHMKEQKRGKIIFTSSGVGVTGFMDISAYASSKGAIESLAKCLNIEYQNTGITFHIMHPPLTKTTSAGPLPVPDEFKADAIKVGTGLAKNIDKKKFVICHSWSQAIMVKLVYLFPVRLGRMMSKMTAKGNIQGKKQIM